MNERKLVCVVEDDPIVRQSLAMLIGTLGAEVRSHAGGRAFLDDPDSRRAHCVVMDVRMPGLSGLEVQSRMAGLGIAAPVIFITGHGDVPMAVEAMRGGAVDFLQKPFDNQALLDRVREALDRGYGQREEAVRRRLAAERLALLSPREREVLALIVEGRMNKTIAADLGISVKTVEDHRANLMRKLRVRSVAELVRLAEDARRAAPG